MCDMGFSGVTWAVEVGGCCCIPNQHERKGVDCSDRVMVAYAADVAVLSPRILVVPISAVSGDSGKGFTELGKNI